MITTRPGQAKTGWPGLDRERPASMFRRTFFAAQKGDNGNLPTSHTLAVTSQANACRSLGPQKSPERSPDRPSRGAAYRRYRRDNPYHADLSASAHYSINWTHCDLPAGRRYTHLLQRRRAPGEAADGKPEAGQARPNIEAFGRCHNRRGGLAVLPTRRHRS